MTAPETVSILAWAAGQHHEVEAETTLCPGLAVHPDIGDGDLYALTHQRSGLCVGFFSTRYNARRAAAELAPLADWTQPVDRDALRPRVQVILARWGAWPVDAEDMASLALARSLGGAR